MRTDLVPLWLNWTGRRVLVVGLGAVGHRRALTFQRAGARVTGIDPMPTVQGSAWGELIRGGLELKAEPYDASIFDEPDLSDPPLALVLACATREVNARVVADATARHLWVASSTSLSDRPGASAHLGAVCGEGFVKVAVHSGNVAPALSAAVSDYVRQNLLPPAERLAAEMARWRTRIVNDSALPPEVRQSLLAAVGDPSQLLLETREPGKGVDELRRFLVDRLGPLPPAGDLDDSESMPR